MPSIECIGVRYKRSGKIYNFLPCQEAVEVGNKVVVEVDSGVEIATVVYVKKIDVPNKNSMKKVIRLANTSDIEAAKENDRDNDVALKICKKIVLERKEPMKLLKAEFSLDRNKVTFYFGAKERIDFRELVKELAFIFKVRIEMRQVNPREESKITSGVGICGRELCCASFLTATQNISIKTIKNSALAINPYKLLGNCGKVMCCAVYEQDNAEKQRSDSSEQIIVIDDVTND